MEETIGYKELLSPEEWDSLDLADPDQPHTVTVWSKPGEHAGNDDGHELECDVCGYIGTLESQAAAETVARLHEKLGASLALPAPRTDDRSELQTKGTSKI